MWDFSVLWKIFSIFQRDQIDLREHYLGEFYFDEKINIQKSSSSIPNEKAPKIDISIFLITKKSSREWKSQKKQKRKRKSIFIILDSFDLNVLCFLYDKRIFFFHGKYVYCALDFYDVICYLWTVSDYFIIAVNHISCLFEQYQFNGHISTYQII